MQKIYSLPVSGPEQRESRFWIPKRSGRRTPRRKYYHISCPSKFFSAHAFAFSAGLVTIPTTLYRFEKKVIQSSSVCFSLSSRSSHSGFTSSAFVLVRARAREASWPANTVQTSVISIFLEEGRIVDSQACRKGAYRDKSRLSRRTCFQLHRILCPVSGNLSAVLNIVGSLLLDIG